MKPGIFLNVQQWECETRDGTPVGGETETLELKKPDLRKK